MNILALTYWSYKEPLIQAATLPHLETILRILPPGSKIYLLTLEKKQWSMSASERKTVEEQLQHKGITLITQNYYPFGWKAAAAWVRNLWRLKKLCKKENIGCLHAFGTPVGAATYVLFRLSRIPFIVDSYEPHAEAMIENKTWKEGAVSFKLLFYFERMQTKHASAVLPVSGMMTEYAYKKYKLLPANSIPRPATVDINQFTLPDEEALTKKSNEHENKIVGIYAGKFGGIYLEDEIFILIKAACTLWNDKFRMIILSDASPFYINHKCKTFGIPENQVILKKVEHKEVSNELKLADFALNPVKPVPSKRYCTSIKDCEYWATGLPVIITEGISDDTQLIREYNAGVVWEKFSFEGCSEAILKMHELLKEDKDKQRLRIRDLAIRFRNSEMNEDIYRTIYDKGGIIHLKIKRILVLIYNSFRDPLFQNLMLEYITTQSTRHPNYRFDLLTFEQKEYALTKEELEHTKIELSGKKIFWHPLQYHSGKFLLLKKLFDFLLATKEVFLIRLKARPKMIFSFANAAAAIGIVLAKIFRTKHLVYSYEPHSEFLVDFGIWKKNSVRYKIMHRLETYAGMHSDVILTGTEFMKTELENKGSRAKVYRAPSAVNEHVFIFSQEKRDEIRNKLNINNKKVIIYVGKFGGIYYDTEITEFLKSIWTIDNNYYFIILSPNDPKEIEGYFEKSKLDKSHYFITKAHNPKEVAAWNSAADAGLNAIPPLSNQKYRSPVKVAEYLLCGLPYIVCKGVSEDDIYAVNHKVGAVVPELSAKTAKMAQDQLMPLFQESPDVLRERCRSVGLEYRSKSKIDNLLETIITEIE